MQVIKMNEYRKTKFLKNIFNKLFNTISGKEIAVFGFSFKKDTKDTRYIDKAIPFLSIIMNNY